MRIHFSQSLHAYNQHYSGNIGGDTHAFGGIVDEVVVGQRRGASELPLRVLSRGQIREMPKTVSGCCGLRSLLLPPRLYSYGWRTPECQTRSPKDS